MWANPSRCALGFAVALALALCGCARGPATPDTAPPSEPAKAEARDPFADQPYADTPLPESVKVLLVAGGDDVANFAADMLAQRALWRDAGLRDDEIACYYAKPTAAALAEDREQYEAVAPELTDCYAASPAVLHEHLRAVARRQPPFVYLFITSHGLPPLLRWSAGVEDANALPEQLELQPGEIGRFDRHVLGLEAGPGPSLGDVDGVLAAHRAGAPASDLVVTPATLAEALTELPTATPVVIAIQACFSGGFIARPTDDGGPSELTERAHTTILTATSPGRPSFGCGPGVQHTYFGGALNRVLAETLPAEGAAQSPAELPWPQIYRQVAMIVEAIETIEGERPSQPNLWHEGRDYSAPQPSEAAATAE